MSETTENKKVTLDIFDGETVFLHRNVGGDTVILRTRKETWPEILEQFEDFLRGCGYAIDGEFALKEDEEQNEKQPASK